MPVKSIKVGKGKSEVIDSAGSSEPVWLKRYYEIEIVFHVDVSDETVQSSRLAAEKQIDAWLDEPHIPKIPDFDLEEINKLPWRLFQKGSAPSSACPDKPGWLFRNEDPKLGDALKKVGKLTLGDWDFELRGTDGNLINRRKVKR